MEESKSIVRELNEKHAVIMIGGKCVIMNLVINPITGHPDINFSSMADLRNRYSNRSVLVGKKHITIANIWLCADGRRQYEGIIFAPQKEDFPDYYNLWQGFSVDPKKGDWEMMKDHIFEIVCNDNDHHFNWLMAWLARIVQSPGGERPGTAVVMRGPQGIGKGYLASNFGKIFGPHFRHLTNPKHLAGNFNAHLKDAIFVFVDEGFWAGDRSIEGILKGLVTEDIIMLEAKGKDAFPIHNHMNLLMASNNDWVVPAGLNERRFAVFDVSDKRAGDRAYFNKLFKLMDNGGREAMLHELLAMDFSEIDLRTIPRTEALLDQMLASMDSVQAFWFDCLDSGTITSEVEWPMSLLKKDVYSEYLAYSSRQNLRHPDSQKIFGRKLMKYCPAIKSIRFREGASRPWSYKFPSLNEFRQAFEQILKMPIPWSE